MPRTRSLAWSELKIGLLTLTAVAVAGFVIFLLSGEGGFFWQRYELRAKFNDVALLKSGAPVRVAGVAVGAVSDMQFDGAEVEVRFYLSKEMQPRVTDQSVAYIGSVSLLGEGALDISPALGGTPIPENGYVKTKRTPGQLSDVAESATQSLKEATLLIQDIRQGKGTVGKLFTDEQLYNEIQGFVNAAESVATNLEKGRGTAGKLLTDDAIYTELEASLVNLRTLTDKLNRGEGSLGKLMQDPAFAESISSTARNLDTLTARLNKGEGTAGKLLTDDGLYRRIDALTGRLDTLTSDLNEGKGTAGALLKDQKLYDNLNAAASELRGLVADIRKDPQKYLRVKVSIF
ncbi:MAG: MCE family protein [Vicinamibacteria bacterium]|nr:MCE family protein [Vicinamibacteria bacterium]